MANKLRKQVFSDLKLYKITKVNRTQLKPDKIILCITLNGIINPGTTMTINQLAKIVTDGFEKVNARLDEHERILNEHSQILKEHSQVLNEHSRILKKHSAIFKRNNLK